MTNILVTGKPGTGKTTLIKKLIPLIPSAGGFYTEEILEANKLTGFKIIIIGGKAGILARKGKKSTEDSLTTKQTVVIDEIGKMGLFSEKFKQAVIKTSSISFKKK